MTKSRFIVGAMIAIAVCVGAVFSQMMPGRGQLGPRIVSPEVQSDKKVTFRLLAPKATEVVLTGSWDIGNNIAMTKNDQGIWSVTVGPLGEQLWWYSFRVDGLRVLDPGNGEIARDGAQYDNWLMIPGPFSDSWEFKPDVPHGAVQSVWYPSEILKQKGRRMYVYTPPDYMSGDAKYPVLYLLHGGGGDSEHGDGNSAGGFAEDGDIVGVAAELGDIVMDPFETGDLILDAVAT
jgi:hypothetical protein